MSSPGLQEEGAGVPVELGVAVLQMRYSNSQASRQELKMWPAFQLALLV
jgi:hypothetical protein